MHKNSKIFISGHNGLVGSSILKYFNKKNYKNIYTIEKKKIDLRDQVEVEKYFRINKFQYVVNCAAKVGGIYANNKYRGEFIYDNLMIQNNIIHNSYKFGVKSLIFLGSSCIYPKKNKVPIKEKDLLTGALEQTNEPYAIAKIAGIKMCESYNRQYKTNFKCLMPCNLYGPNDNYDLNNSHFLPALIKKIYISKLRNLKTVSIWGSGKPKRELMYVDDLAEACLFFLNKRTQDSLINVGSGYERSIYQYAKLIAKKLNYTGRFVFDATKPDGVKVKTINSNIAKKYGWKAKISFTKGLDLTINDFLKNLN